MGELIPLADGTVRREPSGNTEFVELVLRELEVNDFDLSPRFLGRDRSGQEILSYIPGLVVHESPRFGPALMRSIGETVRRFHDIMSGSGLAGDSETVGHGNLGPHSMVVDQCQLLGIISWSDYVAPQPRRYDLAHVVWYTADIGEQGPALKSQAERARWLCDGYGEADYDAVLGELTVRFERARRTHAASGRDRSVRVFEQKLDWMTRMSPELLNMMSAAASQ